MPLAPLLSPSRLQLPIPIYQDPAPTDTNSSSEDCACANLQLTVTYLSRDRGEISIFAQPLSITNYFVPFIFVLFTNFSFAVDTTQFYCCFFFLISFINSKTSQKGLLF